MKNIQTSILKILTVVGLLLACDCVSAQNVEELQRADSLFNQKQYTQSFEIYHRLQSAGHYSPAMLLRMAYIQEGLGDVSLSLYYLNLYYLASGDEQALEKMNEFATKNRLEGFDNNPMYAVWNRLGRYQNTISLLALAIIVLLLALQVNEYRKNRKSIGLGVVSIMLLVVVAILANFSWKPDEAIISESNTYLMTGPSAGAQVVTHLNKGHKLRVLDKKDVWLKVEWLGEEAYVKETQVLPIRL